MYNKISSIILNSAKAVGLSDVYIAQPDALKESQAGKVFILAEIGGKKSEGQKFFDFLIMALSDNYYNDEKILFKDKIPGLKIENIFEAAVTKTNRDLADFLVNEKIRLNPADANLTIGVVYEDKVHFASFGRNRSLLIFRRGDEYEIINVEANAAEATEDVNDAEAAPSRAPKLFSSVISGEIPLSSYFVLSNEALPEYLTGKEMISIITKLPPLAAAEQIKNVLTKVNTYIPFLGVIVKNTIGLATPDSKEELEDSMAHSSISSLNYTEEKTERMLAPAGLINLAGVLQGAKDMVKNMQTKPAKPVKKHAPAEDDEPTQPILELGTVKSMNVSGSGSFMKADKLTFKKGFGFGSGFKKIGAIFGHIFSSKNNNTVSVAGKKSKAPWLFAGMGLALVVLVVSIVITNKNKKLAAEEAHFNQLITAVNDKENEISSHLLYNDESGAASILSDAQSLLTTLPQETDSQKAAYQELSGKLSTVAEKLQKVVRVPQADKVNDLAGLGVNNLALVGGKIYAAGSSYVYAMTPGEATPVKVEITGSNNLSNPHKDFNKEIIHYWDNGNIADFSYKTKTSILISTAKMESAASLTGYKIYNGKLYAIARDQNQIYSYVNKDGFSTKTDWLKDSVDLSKAVDLGIDGDVYVLKSDGSVLKFFRNKLVDFNAGALSPTMSGANKLIVGASHLYIFDASAKRLAVLSKKDGSLMNQYIVDSLTQPKDAVVDEGGKVAYFLDGEAVYKISLNQ